MNKTFSKYFLLILIFLFYLYHLAPGVIWGDSAKLIINSFIKNMSIQPSFHSLHTIVGIVFGTIPIGDFAYRINLLSAFFGSLTIFLLYNFLIKLSGSNIAALSACVSLAVSHTFFLLSVIAETYTLYTFFLMSIIYLLFLWEESRKDYFLYIAIFTFCLSLFNHLLIILSLPGFIYYIVSSDRQFFTKRKNIFLSIISVLLGLIPILIVSILVIVNKDFNTLITQLKNDPARIAVSFVSLKDLFIGCLKYISFLMYQFPIFGFFIGFLGFFKIYSNNRKLFFFFFLILLINVIFVLHYVRQKQYSLSIGSYLIFAIYIGIGTKFVIERFEKYKKIISISILLALITSPFILYSNIISLSKKLNIDLVKARYLPYRDNNKFFLIPSKRHEFGPYFYANEVFRTAKLNSIIIADFTPKIVLDYFKIVKKYRPDIKLIFVDYPFSKLDVKIVDENIDKFPIYLASIEFEKDYNLAELQKKYELIPDGPLYKITKK